MQRFLSYENTILAVVMMVSFINPFTSSALTTALPGIGTAYGATDAQLIASSVVSTVRLIGQVLSVAIITLILSQSGASAASDWLAQHIQQAFIVFTILCSIGIVPSAARSK